MARTLETATSLGNARLRAYALLGLGGRWCTAASSEAGQRLDDAAEASARPSTGGAWRSPCPLRGQLALVAGDHAAAQAMHEEALAAAETVDNDYLRAQLLDMLGLDAATIGDVTGARDRYGRGRRTARPPARLRGIRLLPVRARRPGAGPEDRPGASARLIGASDYARGIVGVAVWPGMRSADQAQRTAVTGALSPASFAAAAAEGARMRIPDALGYGLAATAAEQVSDPFPAWAPRLKPAT